MQFNIELDTTEKFKKFWNWMAEENETAPHFILSEFRFNIDELFDRVDDEEAEYDDELYVWKDEIDSYYLTGYYIAHEDDWDRGGDVKTRMAIRMADFISMDDVIVELPKLRERRLVIAKKYDLAIATKNFDVGPTADEMNEMKSIDEKLEETYGF